MLTLKTQKIKLWWNSKIQIVIKLKNSNGDKTPKLKLWKNPETQIVTKQKKITCDLTQIVTKLKLGQNSNFDKTQIVIKLKTKKKIKLWQNSKTKFLTKLKNSISDKTQKLKLWGKKLKWQISIYDKKLL